MKILISKGLLFCIKEASSVSIVQTESQFVLSSQIQS